MAAALALAVAGYLALPWAFASARLAVATVPTWQAPDSGPGPAGPGQAESLSGGQDSAVAFIAIGRQAAASARLLMAMAAVRTLGKWHGPLYLLTDDPGCVRAFLQAEASCSPPGTCKGVHPAAVVLVDAMALGSGAAMGAKSLKALLPVALPHETILYLDADVIVTAPVEGLIAAAIGGCTSAICMPTQPGGASLRVQEPFHSGVILFRNPGPSAAMEAMSGPEGRVAPRQLDVAAAEAALGRLATTEPLPGSPWACLEQWRAGMLAGQRRRDQQVLGDLLAAKGSLCHVSAMPAVLRTRAASGSGAAAWSRLLWFPDLSAHSMPPAAERLPAQPALPALLHLTSYRLWRLPGATAAALQAAVGLPLTPARADDTCIGARKSLPWIPQAARGAAWFRSPGAMSAAEQETLWEALGSVWAPLRPLLWATRRVSDVIAWRQSALEFLDATGT
ncbi:hypothetical protein FNF29_02714 [Cafeteria roenbergensis]|uniref:Nucleotide-diphospho-sugar transferase domain-containing protein n=1 Tax=Cafeteria roenbergensis TaxID=33653 RepID=A0A5A8CQL1_CAFRO|nr:hypothetical protein FNF29_02714 [Cafeteria roenbergensis]|eukprot:KAA0154091.1 hypothetical protein FNF29_02714 [Cafeteria roenbergensis]